MMPDMSIKTTVLTCPNKVMILNDLIDSLLTESGRASSILIFAGIRSGHDRHLNRVVKKETVNINPVTVISS